LAVDLVVGFSLVSISSSAISLGFNVLGFGLVEVAVILRVSEDDNVLPWGWVPIGVVISFLGTFISVSVSIVVLSGVDGSGSSCSQTSFIFSVSNKETHVSVSGLAVLVVLVRLVHSEGKFSVGFFLERSIGVIGDGVGGRTISDIGHTSIVGRTAHVLNDDVANHFRIATTTVLDSPFDHKEGLLVEVHGRANAISSLSVILGVEQSVSIVSVGIGFIETIVRTSWVV
jgi:hypothetical protein